MNNDPRQTGGNRSSPSEGEAHVPELVEPGGGDPFSQHPFGPGSEQYSGTPSDQTPFGGGRVRVYGCCSPSCLMISIAVSLVLSIILTLVLNALL
jgi:hypothetical protein